MRRMCELFEISRAGLYYKPVGESEYDILLMNLIDEQYTKMPFYGSRKIRKWLLRKGYSVCREKVQRLMREMGIEAIYPHKNTSKPDKEHIIYPYLLRNVAITRPNQVWGADITYIRLLHGFMYLIAIMDLYSRYVVSWKISNTLDAVFCTEALNDALKIEKPDISNTDQGSQFTSNAYTEILKTNSIQISMDSKGRAMDNIFVERLWRSLKYEDIYIHNYETPPELYKGLTRYFDLYNNERLHESLDYKTPWEVHFGIGNIPIVAEIACYNANKELILPANTVK